MGKNGAPTFRPESGCLGDEQMDSGPSDLSVLSRLREKNATNPIPFPAPRWKTRLLLPACILVAFLALAAYALRSAFWPSTVVRVMPVLSKEGGDSAGALLFQAAGWVEPDPYPTHIPALIDGIVKEVLVLEGQSVKAGDIVARLVDEEAQLEAKHAEAELHHKRGHLSILQATFHAARAEWDHPVERERAVAVADAMHAEATAELQRSAREIAVEDARVKELQEQLRREDMAAEVQAIPEIQRTQTRLKLNTQRATLDFIHARIPILEAKVKQTLAELTAARENLRLRITEKRALEESEAGVCEAEGQVQMAMIAAEQARLRLKRTEVRSPVDGVVMQRLVEPGGKLMAVMDDKSSAQVARLYDPAKLQVRVDVPLSEAARVGVGQKVRVTVEVLREKVFEGVVTRIVNEADIQKNTLQVKVSLTAPAPELKPEMLARAQFIASESNTKNAVAKYRLFILEDAIQKSGERGIVWIVDKGRSTAIRREVTLGTTRQNGWLEVTQGLQLGDAVIVGDTSTLREGQSIRVQEESANAAAQKENPHGVH